MHSHYAAINGLPSSLSMSLDVAFDSAEENLWDDDDPIQRPPVPGPREQVLDTDYDPDPAQEATPLKNVPPKKPGATAKKPARKR
ncbi:MAG: hypothetical protein V4650_01630 [Pseudomonadota bacterium]